jgi:FtsP/CotA-like multicopper oxidase with cupredoxin domain
MIQIGTEGGILPGPVVHLNTPVGFEQNKRNIVVLNVLEKTLFMAPAERADVIVDFSKFAGKTIILYNDSPAPVPASDPRYDFYTGNPDYSATAGVNNQGGAPSTVAGFGPNTRTIMQFRVGTGANSTAPVDDYDASLLVNLQNPTTGLPAIFKTAQDAPVVPESAYNALAYTGGATTDTFALIQNLSLTFTPYGSNTATTMQMKNPTIQELFDPQGRMNATLGVELPFTGALIQTTVPLGFKDPTTEIIGPNQTQLWKITHNGVDTHGIHFHLVNVQVINRVGWDGAVRETDPNELGWKDTVRMNPLEDIIVAMRAKTPTFPFTVPNSVRPLDPTMPVGSTFPSLDPLTGASITVTNKMYNFGWEYTWHCHILGHEENDMMRAFVMRRRARADFDGDHQTDVSIYRPSTGWWIIVPSSNPSAPYLVGWGAAGDIQVSGDYDGDGKTDVAVYRPSTGWWIIVPSSNPSAPYLVGWGVAGDIPVPGDYDGDGKTDVAVYRPSTGWWIIVPSSNPSAPYLVGWGAAGDIPVSGDFDGDGKTDVAIYRPSTGWWIINPSATGVPYAITWGGDPTDTPVPGDYDHDGIADLAYYRASTGTWNISPSSGAAAYTLPWGITGDVPITEANLY